MREFERWTAGGEALATLLRMALAMRQQAFHMLVIVAFPNEPLSA
jgi:hypothetical protein